MDSSSLSQPWIGRSIGDHQRYCIQQSIGGGSMGDVFLATDTRLGQPVALKILKGDWVGAPELHRRFNHEVALCAALKGEHVVQVSDYGISDEGYPFYVMEYLQGQTLGNLFRQAKRLSVQRAVNIVMQVCAGLELAHDGVILPGKGDRIRVVHRDLKPENIFVIKTSLGELVKILDFGIAKIQHEQRENTHHTQVFIGTFHYASPEQVEVRQDLDGRSDIYSLGVILYELLSGTDPFGFGELAREMSQMSWAVAHASRPPIPLRQQPGCEAVPATLEAIVMRCLQKQPGDRFPTVQALSQALQSIALPAAPAPPTQVATPPIARPVPPPIATRETASRPKGIGLAIAGFVLAVSMFGVFLWLQQSGSQPASKSSPSPSPKSSSPSPPKSPSTSPSVVERSPAPSSPVVPTAVSDPSSDTIADPNVDVDKLIREYRPEPPAPIEPPPVVEPAPVVIEPPVRPEPELSPTTGWEDEVPPSSSGGGTWEDNPSTAPPTDNSGGNSGGI
jgi:eukaryotic-like serine/threonine-protein kinase